MLERNYNVIIIYYQLRRRNNLDFERATIVIGFKIMNVKLIVHYYIIYLYISFIILI